jgi:uncharacterized protein YukE
MADGMLIDPEIARDGGEKILTATTGAFTPIVNAAAEVRAMLDAKPAGGGGEGARFDAAHEAVVTAMDAAQKLQELIQEMAENIVNGATNSESADQTAANILYAACVNDIPDFKF